MLIENLSGIDMYCFQWNYIDSNMYVILEGKQALVIDPLLTEEIEQFWRGKNLSKIIIILTHEHFDHIIGLNWLKERYPCEVYANKVCAADIESESKNLSNKSDVIAMFNADVGNRNIHILPFRCCADVIFEHTKKFKWQNHNIELIITPGHTEGSICIVLDEKYLFTGDTLLEIPTITRLPGGSKKRFEQITLPVLNHMKSRIVRVYPGHGNFGELETMLRQYNDKI